MNPSNPAVETHVSSSTARHGAASVALSAAVDDDSCQRELINDKTKTKILLVDNDPTFAYCCKRYLRKAEYFDHTVVTASSAHEAMTICRVDSFDCIVVDYSLPDKAGTELIRDLNVVLGHSIPSTIVLTAHDGQDSAIEAVRSGATDFLPKRDVTQLMLCKTVGNAVEKSFLRQSLTHRIKELENANGLLLKRNAEIQRFYHTVSHEVKTPLTAIQEFVAIVHDGLAGNIEQEQKTILKYALQSCEQISSHFNDLLELSRFETGKMTIELSPSSIYEVFDHCIVSSTPAAVAKGITLSIEDQPDLPLVMIQPNRIIQVLTNLINNAIKFTDEGGTVTVGCELAENASMLRLSVRDTGCGIRPRDIKKVFDRLYQVTPGSEQESDNGLGLGLSIASEIVQLHGNKIELESKVHKGSTFYFNLKICVPDDQMQAA